MEPAGGAAEKNRAPRVAVSALRRVLAPVRLFWDAAARAAVSDGGGSEEGGRAYAGADARGTRSAGTRTAALSEYGHGCHRPGGRGVGGRWSRSLGPGRGHGHTVPFYCGSRSHPYGQPQEGGNSRRAPLFFLQRRKKHRHTVVAPLCPRAIRKTNKEGQGKRNHIDTVSPTQLQPRTKKWKNFLLTTGKITIKKYNRRKMPLQRK